MREQRQSEAVQAFLNSSDRRCIINACPRFGKIKVAIDIMKNMDVNHIWILAPRNDIFKGWNDDFEKFGYRPTIVGETTFTSIKKIETKLRPELIIIDEPHELSVNQQVSLAEKLKGYNGPILGLTGTMTQKTRTELYNNLNLDVCFKYTILEGVKEGILTDYRINVHQIMLDNKRYVHKTKKGKSFTEQGFFNLYKYIRDNSRNKGFMDLKLINILQNSISKMEETRRLIKAQGDKRVLVFCGTTNIADKLGIEVYHSKKKEEPILNDFCVGGGMVDQLATIKMMQAGITIKPINTGIINYMSGNPEDSAQKICRFLGFEYDNPNKQADIHIVCSNEEFELSRLKTGLAFFDESKINHIIH